MRILAFVIIYLCLSITAALAIPIEFVFNIADRELEFNNVTTNTGAHQMRISVDTSATNLGTGFGDFANFYAADVFFDAPGLGLANSQVVSDTFLYFGNGVVGFSDQVSGVFTTIYTVANPGDSINDNFEFGGTDGNVSGFDLSQIDIPQILIGMTVQELRTANDIVFDTGDRITGGITVRNRNDSISVGAVSAVPLPAALPLFAGGIGLLGLFGWRRKRMVAA